MMEDNDKNLEHFFKKKFAQNAKPEPWNTPEEEIWQNIQANIRPEKKRRRGFFYFWPLLFGALGLFSAAFFYWQNNKYQQRVKELELKLEECGTPENNINPEQTGKLIQNSLDQTPASAKVMGSRSEANGSSSNPNVPSLGSSDFAAQAMSLQIANATNGQGIGQNEEPLSTAVGLPQNNKTIGQTERLQRAATDMPPYKHVVVAIAPRAINQLIIPDKLLTINIFNNPLVLTSKTKQFGAIQFGLSAQTSAWEDRNFGQFDNPLSELLKEEYTQQSFNYGLMMQKSIAKRWAVHIGMYYGQHTQISRYELSIPYTMATEHTNPDGSHDNAFTHSLPSGLGSVDTKLVLNRAQNSTVTDQEKVNLDFDFEQQSQALTVPIKVQFYPKMAQKGLFFSAGISNEVIFRNNLKVTNVVSHHTTIHEKSVGVSLGDSQQSKYNIRGLLDVGYQLPIGKKTSAMLAVGYNRALNNQYQAGGFSHKLDHWSLSMGIVRNIGN